MMIQMRQLWPGALLASLLAAACGGAEPAGPGDDPASVVTVNGVHYRAATAVMESFPVQLRTQVLVTNTGSSEVRFVFPDGCLVLLQATRVGGDPARPVWQQQAACTLALMEITLRPGSSRSVSSQTVSALDILGDSLPDGAYELQAVLRPVDQAPVVVPAGSVGLAVPR